MVDLGLFSILFDCCGKSIDIGPSCIDSILKAVYEVDFTSVIMYELHDRAFRDLTIMPYPYFIQQLCDKAGVHEITDIDRLLEVMSITQISMVKDLVNPILAHRSCAPPIVIPTHLRGLQFW